MTTAAPREPDLGALLDRMPGWRGRARIVRALDGGITNRNFLVDVEGARFVLRVAGSETELLEVDRSCEFEAATRAAALGIAPAVIGWIEPEQYLITEFVDGIALSPHELATQDRLRTVAASLRLFHKSPPLRRDFSVFSVPFRHLEVALARGAHVPNQFDRAASCAASIEAVFKHASEPRVAAHNDLLNANFLAAGTRVWLIDWEYAGNNDRYFDLANLSINNSFDGAADDTLLTEYFGAVTDRRLARLALMKIMSDFREAMWGVVQHTISTFDFDYLAYSTQHFERLLENAAAPEYGARLQAAATAER